MKRYMMIWTFLCCCIAPLLAVVPALEDADNAFLQKKYKEAIRGYEAVLQQGENADIYYNLGNAYFRVNDLGRAVLSYERALALAPADEDVRHNLEVCQAKVANQFNLPSEMFFITWLRDLVMHRSCDAWGGYALLSLFLGLVGFGAFRYGRALRLRQVGLAVAVLGALCFVLCNIAAAWNWHSYAHDDRAVVVEPVALMKDSQPEAELVMDLQPGVVVRVLEETLRGWMLVELPNTKTGWLRSAAVEKVKPAVQAPAETTETVALQAENGEKAEKVEKTGNGKDGLR